MPEGEELEGLARSGATLAIHLSIRSIGAVCESLAPFHGADCPAAVVYRASWPDERIVTGTLADLAEKVRPLRLRRTALILVGRVLAAESFDDSALYDAAHHHLLRPRKKAAGGGLSRFERSSERRLRSRHEIPCPGGGHRRRGWSGAACSITSPGSVGAT